MQMSRLRKTGISAEIFACIANHNRESLWNVFFIFLEITCLHVSVFLTFPNNFPLPHSSSRPEFGS